MTKPKLIALYSEKMQSGKSEVAKFLCEKQGFIKVSFASPLKAMIASLLSTIGHDTTTVHRMIDGDLKEVVLKGIGKTPRHMMQTLGTEWGRDTVKSTLWADVSMERIKGLMEDGYSVVVDDMRFPNEFHTIQAAMGQTVRVVRSSANTATTTHPSEGLLNNFIFNDIVHNEGTIVDLHREVADTLGLPVYQP